ncbi:hypothetical protein KEM48_000958 [Puccinia striiformis f. sp. tritici PST-130]|nr:hypothetical protein KEM48_000958 [Puccinia striiformis f. sp. tritici PST-130]
MVLMCKSTMIGPHQQGNFSPRDLGKYFPPACTLTSRYDPYLFLDSMLDSAGKPSYMSEHQRHWHLGSKYGFERLETKCDLKRNEPSDPMSIDHVFPALSVDDLEKQENLLNQLHSKFYLL